MNFSRNEFCHKLKEHSLVRDDSREFRYYIHPDGTEFMSVTSFLSTLKSDGKDELVKWRNAVGEAEAARISKVATDKGTAIHLAAEYYLTNNEQWKTIPFVYKPDFMALARYFDGHINNVLCLEHMMYSKRIKLAGTVDCIAEHDGVLSIVDFKTSSRIKYKQDIENYFLQCACYGLMAFELYGIAIKQISIIMAVEGQNAPLIFNEPMAKWAKQILELTKSP